MFINVVKKIGMMLIYYFIGTFFSTALDMFGILPERGIIYALLHALAIGAIICAISRYLRIGKLKKEHKGDESQEKAVFNGGFGGKLKFIISTKDFIIEAIMYLIFTVIYFANVPLVIILTLYMMTLDVITWLSAYNSCYKRKEF